MKENFYEVTDNELEEVNGGVSGAVVAGIVVGGILVVSAAVETFNGYQEEKRKCN